MAVLLNSPYGIFVLILALAGFIWFAVKKFEIAVYLILFLLPLYLVKINIFFVPFNVSEILIWILFVVWLQAGKFKNIKLAEIEKFALPALVIFISTTFSVFASQNLIVSVGILKGWFLVPLIFALVLLSEIREKKQIQRALYSIFLSAFLVGAVALIYFFLGKVTFDGRLCAFFLSPNYLAMYLAPGFLIGLWLQSQISRKAARIVPGTGLIVIAVALYLALSYLTWLSILITVIFWGAMNFKWQNNRKKLLFASCLLFALLLAILISTQAGSEKMNNFLHSPRSSWQSRIMIWRSAWEIVKDNPIFGIGPGMFQEHYLNYQSRFAVPYLEWAVPQPHNIFLAFWLQCGLAGLAGLIWLLAVFFKKTFGLLKSKNQLALVLIMILVYTILGGLADTTYFKNDLAVIFWTVIALGVSL